MNIVSALMSATAGGVNVEVRVAVGAAGVESWVLSTMSYTRSSLILPANDVAM